MSAAPSPLPSWSPSRSTATCSTPGPGSPPRRLRIRTSDPAAHGAVTGIDVIADPDRLRAVDIAVLDAA
ncbi:hypothetical protein ACFV6E_06275 [Streptomyces sp. NPDC059785]|uniref:hypothetical protein n=1 Tax=unclassified Streptomyces TaxID=2593676 RepID=UPI00365F3F37